VPEISFRNLFQLEDRIFTSPQISGPTDCKFKTFFTFAEKKHRVETLISCALSYHCNSFARNTT